MKPGPRGRRYQDGRYAVPAGFTDWHHLFREYFKGLAEHKKQPRGTRGSYQEKFCRENDISRFEINRLQSSYRVAYLEPGPHQEEARELFERFLNGEFGPDSLREKIIRVMNRPNAPDPQAYKSALGQVAYHLEQVRAILAKLDQDIPDAMSDDEVHQVAKDIWVGRQSLSTWYNSHIRLAKPQVLKRMEGKRP